MRRSKLFEVDVVASSVCLVLHPVLVAARAKFPTVKIFAYMDDVTLACKDPADLSACAQYISEEFGAMKVRLNPVKCEWFGSRFSERTGVALQFKDASAGIKILGCYLSRDKQWISDKLCQKMTKHEVFFERLSMMEAYAACVVLGVCGIPRIAYYTRVHAPDDISAAAATFDNRVEKAWSDIAMCKVDDITRNIAHLPASLGGMGFTRFNHIAATAYEASMLTAMGTKTSQHDRVLATMRRLAE